jgi:heat shock protein HslJ
VSSVAAAASSAKAAAGSALSSAKAEAGSALSSAEAQASSAIASAVSSASAAGADAVAGVYTGTGPGGGDWTLTFTAGGVTAKGDCNTMSGSVDTSTEVLKVGPMASTMMACDDAKMAQDHAISEFLTGNPTWTVDGDSLVLTNADTTYVLTKQG